MKMTYYKGPDVLSARKYNAVIGLCLLWGFMINAVMVQTCTDFFLKINPILLIIFYFVSCLAGIFIAKGSSNPLISFIGYNLIVVPIGAVLSVFLVNYNPAIVFRAVIATAIVTLVMTIMAMVYPNVFLSMGRALFIGLLLAIIIEFIMLLMGFNPIWLDWVIVLIFCGYIGFDWARANTCSKTTDNAIDCVIDLYLDIINIFIRLVSIFGKSSKD